MTKWLYIIPVIIYIVVPTLLIVGIIFSYKKKSVIFRCIVCLLLFLFGMFLSLMFYNEFIEDPKRQRTMAGKARELLECTTMLREGKTQRAIGYLDGIISSSLRASAWDRDMENLPPEIMHAWQRAKVYYDKYEVASRQYGPDHVAAVREKLKLVPWSQRETDKRAFKAKYQGNNPQTAPELGITKWFGPALSLSKLRGKVILLDFWGVWCDPCLKLLPHTQELYAKYNEMGLEVIGIHSSFGTDKTANFLSENNITFSIGIDSGHTANNYIVTGWPTYYLIDKDGYVAWGPEHDVPSDERIEVLLND